MDHVRKKFVNTLPRGGEEMCSPVESADRTLYDSGSDRTLSETDDDDGIGVMGDRDLLPGFPAVQHNSRVYLISRKFLCTSPYPILLFGMKRDDDSYSFFELARDLSIRGVNDLASELFGDYDYEGYCRDGADVYAVVTCKSPFISCDASVTWHVGSEAVNQRHSFGRPFSDSVVDFFMRRPMFLHQQEGPVILPTPSVWYLPSNGEDIISLRCRGPERHEVDSEVGPFYQLYSYEKAAGMEGLCFLVRYAVFESNLVSSDRNDSDWWTLGSQMISEDGSTLTLVKSDDVHFIEYDDHHSSDSSPAGTPSTSL